MLDFSSVRGILIDIDGTLMRGNNLLDGAVELLEYLDDEKIPYLIVSNNTKPLVVMKTYLKLKVLG